MAQGWLTIVKAVSSLSPPIKKELGRCFVTLPCRQSLTCIFQPPIQMSSSSIILVGGASMSHCLLSHTRISDIGTDSCLKRIVTDFVSGLVTGMAAKGFHNSVFLRLISYPEIIQSLRSLKTDIILTGTRNMDKCINFICSEAQGFF
ncbi:hypothetical protein FKM82_021126 [Ascaphus truei]